MGPRFSRLVDASQWLPRVSGDGPHGPMGKDGISTAAPRERGWARS